MFTFSDPVTLSGINCFMYGDTYHDYSAVTVGTQIISTSQYVGKAQSLRLALPKPITVSSVTVSFTAANQFQVYIGPISFF